MTPCKIWKGYVNGYGRPTAPIDGRLQTVARAVLTKYAGPPPSSKHQASHICQNTMCVEPTHLTWETQRENDLRKPGTKGCYLYRGRYRVRALVNGKRISWGSYDTEEEAKEVYINLIRRSAL